MDIIEFQKNCTHQDIEWEVSPVIGRTAEICFALSHLNFDVRLWVLDDIYHVGLWEKNNGYITQIKSFNSLEDVWDTLPDFLNEVERMPDVYTPPDLKYVQAILMSPTLFTNNFAQSLLTNYTTRGTLSAKQIQCIIGPSNDWKTPLGKIAQSNDKDITQRYLKLIQSEKKQIIEEREQLTEKREYSLKPVKGDDVKLLPTLTHGEHAYPFGNFNPVQSLVYPHIAKDCNIVIGANTSAGKTICAELVMDKVLAEKQTVIYLSPLKSLTQEKYTDWQVRFPNHKIGIMTGDYSISEDKAKSLGKLDILCMTSEMLDSRTRKFKSEKNNWLYRIGLVVVDEAHILDSESRGHALEAGLMRFCTINPDARLLMLSATMPNVEEFGEWSTTLNEKPSEIVFCDWRPVKLSMNYVEYNSGGSYYDSRDAKIDTSILQIQQKSNEKFLVFVHDKTTGRELVKKLKQENIHSVFHNAELDINSRQKIEGSFRTGDLRVLVSTSTLAWGVNLPARNVIIVGVHRGISLVDELDIIQMIGRAGRYGLDTEGFVYMVLPQNSTDKWKYTLANPKPVTSSLKQLPILAFHILGEVHTGYINKKPDVEKWFEKSLAFLQQETFGEQDTDLITENLKKMSMIKQKGRGKLKLTGLGRVSALMYYSPYDIYDWYTNFQSVIENGLDTNQSILAWAIADIETNQLDYVPKNYEDQIKQWKQGLKLAGVYGYSEKLTSIMAILSAYHCLTGTDPRTPVLTSVKRTFEFDLPRMITALEMIDGLHAQWKWDWDTFKLKITYGVDDDLIPLVRIPKVGKARAYKLYEAGMESIEDVAKASTSDLFPEFTKQLAQNIINNAQALLKKRKKS